MDRRGFLKSFAIGIAAASAASIIPSIASTILQPVIPVLDPYEKYKVALEMVEKSYNSWKDLPKYSENNRVRIASAGLDEILTYLRENFSIPNDGNYEECRKVAKWMLRNEWKNDGHTSMYEIMHTVPPIVLEAVWTLGLMITALREYNFPINHRIMKEFQWFHDVYGKLILWEAGIGT